MEFIVYYKRIGILLVLTLFISCNSSLLTDDEEEDNYFLNLYMNNPIDGDFYLVDYPNNSPHSYTSVLYETLPNQRVFWFSTDSFTIYHMGFPITEPIINYSTYSNGEGKGKQMIYLYQPHIGKKLSIFGCIGKKNGDDMCEGLEFIVE